MQSIILLIRQQHDNMALDILRDIQEHMVFDCTHGPVVEKRKEAAATIKGLLAGIVGGAQGRALRRCDVLQEQPVPARKLCRVGWPQVEFFVGAPELVEIGMLRRSWYVADDVQAGRVFARDQRAPGGTAGRAGSVGLFEIHAILYQPIDVWRFQGRIAKAKIGPAQVVNEE